MQLSTKTNFLDYECAKLTRGNPQQVFRPRQHQRKPKYLFPGDCPIRIPTITNRNRRGKQRPYRNAGKLHRRTKKGSKINCSLIVQNVQ